MINTHNTIPAAFGSLITLQENWSQMIEASWDAYKYNSTLFMDFPTEPAPLFQGEYQQFSVFRKGLSHQMGLDGWEPITVSRAPSGDDPGISACDDYTPTILNEAGSEIWRNEMKRRMLASPPICVNDLRTQTLALQQIELRVNFYIEQIREYAITHRREEYMRSIMRANHGYLMNNASLDPSLSTTDNHFYYDMDHNDSTLGVPCLYYKVGDTVGTLNIKVLTRMSRWLASQCPDAATGSLDGMPAFTAYGDSEDLEDAIRKDAVEMENLRYADPSLLIGSWRKFRTYRGVTIAHDLSQMRFVEVGIVAVEASTVHNGRGGYLAAGNYHKCRRVNPERNSDRIGLNGFAIPEANPEYFQADLRLLPFVMTNVLTVQVGTPLENVAGMKFGPQPGYNFETKFLVYPENEKNPFSEKGAWFSRAELGIRPGKNYLNTLAYLYRSCQQNVLTTCATDGTSTAAVALASAVAAADVDVTNKTVTVTLASAIKATNGTQVNVADKDGTADGVDVYVIDATLAPTYVLGFTSLDAFGLSSPNAATFAAELTTAATVQVA